jgi:phage tail sheath protein FI
MAFQVSPGVNVSEIDLTTIVPAVSTSTAAIAGNFNWGPVEFPTLVSSETDLATVFGKPNANNYETFFTAADFLSYGNALYVSRDITTGTSFNAISNTNASGVSAILVKNIDQYNSTPPGSGLYVAKYPGALGNSLKISVCDSNTAYSSSINGINNGNVTITFTTGSNVAIINAVTATNTDSANAITNVINSLTVGDFLLVGNASTYGTQYIQFNGNTATTNNVTNNATANLILTTNYTLSTTTTINANNTAQVALNRYWEFFNRVNAAPGTSAYALSAGGVGDELHVVVVDQDGAFTGVRNTILEVYQDLSSATDVAGDQGGSSYVKNVLNNQSSYVWYGGATRSAHYGVLASATTYSSTTPLSLSFAGGVDSATETSMSLADKAYALDKFASAEDIDISLILTGKSSATAPTANYIIDNICETRKDCVVFVSPDSSLVGSVTPINQIQSFISYLHSSSYAVVDSGYKYRYDKYNDVYRYTPLNGDVAGTAARTDNLRDAWFSPAGFNRGQIKNIVRPAFNPNLAQRDVLYKASVNPVVTFPGQGTILFGDKTFLNKPSAFDRINVRRLFIVLEKAIATAAKFTLFEFNDAFTRSQFRNLIEPFLRDVQGRRGIYDFRVVCDETNNTPEVIDGNRFVGDIYIKPARSINFIQLNFVAVRSGVAFEEIVGRF